ncbi:4Fe-4S binding protein [Sporomusa sphaeroides]|uniref:4Fe-4S binding protein n=1 Tax=Sporomusa sphaeroides TaxID=47679 RepID=UPI002CEEC206|nr:4Fe-4S binding protein [Sporomusa sphaeroides]HML33681.1 4Fe-4S binding protein [Sporomusa sphaeroides]
MSNQTMTQSAGIALTKLRTGVQLAMLAVLGQWAYYGVFRCPYLIPFVSCETCPVITCWGRITSYFWGFWLLLPVSVLLAGRAFCGWLCPGGFVNQLIGKFSLLKLRKRNRFVRFAPAGMAIALAAVAIIWFGMDNPRMMVPIRTGGDVLDSVRLSFEHASFAWLVRTFIILGLAAAGLLVANLWCRFVCPTGGLLELFKGMAIFRVFKTSACNDCDACLRVCEMGTRPDETNCTNCGDCLQSCPVDAIKFGKRGNSNEQHAPNARTKVF